MSAHAGGDDDRFTRVIGLVPLALFALTAVKYAVARQLYDLLWMCNVANLAVGAGLFMRRPALTRVGAIWIVAGTVWWLSDGIYAGRFEALPVFTHFATTAVAAFGVARTSYVCSATRAYCCVVPALFALQGVSRVATPSMANVNFAFESYYGFWAWFPPEGSYAAFWLAASALIVATFTLAELALRAATAWLGPQPRKGRPRP